MLPMSPLLEFTNLLRCSYRWPTAGLPLACLACRWPAVCHSPSDQRRGALCPGWVSWYYAPGCLGIPGILGILGIIILAAYPGYPGFSINQAVSSTTAREMSSGVQPDAAFVQWVVGATGKTQDAARQMVEKLAADGVNSLDDLRELWSEDSVLGVLQHVFPALVRSKIRNALAKKPRLDAGSAAAAVVEQQVSTTLSLACARILRDARSSHPRLHFCRRYKKNKQLG